MYITESHALLKRDPVSPSSSSVVDVSSPNEFVGVNIKRLVPKQDQPCAVMTVCQV
jgi:hypothetical protein